MKEIDGVEGTAGALRGLLELSVFGGDSKRLSFCEADGEQVSACVVRFVL